MGGQETWESHCMPPTVAGLCLHGMSLIFSGSPWHSGSRMKGQPKITTLVRGKGPHERLLCSTPPTGKCGRIFSEISGEFCLGLFHYCSAPTLAAHWGLGNGFQYQLRMPSPVGTDTTQGRYLRGRASLLPLVVSILIVYY